MQTLSPKKQVRAVLPKLHDLARESSSLPPPTRSLIKAAAEHLRNALEGTDGYDDPVRYHGNIIRSISDAVIIDDLDFRIQSRNEAAELMYGFEQGEVLGRRMRDVSGIGYPFDEAERWSTGSPITATGRRGCSNAQGREEHQCPGVRNPDRRPLGEAPQTGFPNQRLRLRCENPEAEADSSREIEL